MEGFVSGVHGAGEAKTKLARRGLACLLWGRDPGGTVLHPTAGVYGNREATSSPSRLICPETYHHHQ